MGRGGMREGQARACLTAVELENFLSFEKARVELDKLTVLVGPNASGKSNFVKALRFLRLLTKSDVRSAASELGLTEFEHVIFRFDPERNIRLHVEGAVGHNTARYEIAVSSNGTVVSERVELDDVVLALRKDEQVKFTGNIKEHRSAKSIGVKEYSLEGSYALLSQEHILRALMRQHPALASFISLLEGFRDYSFNPTAIRREAPIGYSMYLARDGSNLAQVLHTLLTSDRKKFLRIEEVLRDFVPEVEALDVPPTRGGERTYVVLREKTVPEPLSYTNISDGTLRLLAFITAIHLGSPLVAFEEPENCVHPRLLKALVDLCRYGPSQVIITTHSPYLVDHLRPEELRLVVKREGRTEVRPIVSEQKELVRRLLEEGFTLGEIWYSGHLGEGA